MNQPSIKLYKLNRNKENFPQSQEIEDRGFFIGIHVNPINKETLNNLEKKLLKLMKYNLGITGYRSFGIRIYKIQLLQKFIKFKGNITKERYKRMDK